MLSEEQKIEKARKIVEAKVGFIRHFTEAKADEERIGKNG